MIKSKVALDSLCAINCTSIIGIRLRNDKKRSRCSRVVNDKLNVTFQFITILRIIIFAIISMIRLLRG